jgi:putative intracellular protease/amidase
MTTKNPVRRERGAEPTEFKRSPASPVSLISPREGGSARASWIEVDRAAGDLSAGDLDLLVIAGGYGPDKLRMDAGLLGLVRALDEQAKPIAFICHGGWVA